MLDIDIPITRFPTYAHTHARTHTHARAHTHTHVHVVKHHVQYPPDVYHMA